MGTGQIDALQPVKANIWMGNCVCITQVLMNIYLFQSRCAACRLTLTFTLTGENLSLYITLLLYWSFYNYTAHAADILTPTTIVQWVDNHSWCLYCRRCYCLCVRRGRSSRIFHLSRWHGRRDLDFTSFPKDDGEPWERFSESRPNSLADVVFSNQVLNLGHPSKYWPCRMTA